MGDRVSGESGWVGRVFEGRTGGAGSLGMTRDGRGRDGVHETDCPCRVAPILERPSMVQSEDCSKADEDMEGVARPIE